MQVKNISTYFKGRRFLTLNKKDEILKLYYEEFRVTKSELDDRPVFVSTKEHIEAHFLTCYLALVLSRILQHKLDKKYSVDKILEALSLCNCFNIQENIYQFTHYDAVLKDIGQAVNIDFALKTRTLQDIKKILSQTKKN